MFSEEGGGKLNRSKGELALPPAYPCTPPQNTDESCSNATENVAVLKHLF